MSKSVKDFDQRGVKLWHMASLRELPLRPATRQEAVSFRQQLHLLRQAMKREGHACSGAAQRVKIKIEFSAGGKWVAYTNDTTATKAGYDLSQVHEWRLRMVPYDADFDAILAPTDAAHYSEADMFAPPGGKPAMYTRKDGTPYTDIKRRAKRT